jgi:hypothetical protein
MTMLTLQEVQERLRIGRRALRHLIDHDEDFVTIKLGHRRVMRAQSFEDFIAAKEKQDRPNRETKK